MKKVLMLAVALAVAAAPAFAQGAKKADKPAKSEKAAAMSGSVSGTVSAVAADSLTVKAKDGADVTLAVDAKTNVEAVGGSHKAAAAKADNKPTPITDFVKVGDKVSVKYTDSGTAKTATKVHVTMPKPAEGTAHKK